MYLIYRLSIGTYAFIIRIAALFNPKAKAWIFGRKNLIKNLPDFSDKDVYWFHCASLGEFDQGLPIIKQLKDRQPDIFILVTFFSPSGMQHYKKRNAPIDFACYLPIDTRKNARNFVAKVNPKQVYFVKYEFWINYINEVKENNIPLYSVATLLRENQRFFKWYGGIFRKALRKFDHFFAQNNKTEKLLKSIGINQISVTGDTRFDNVIQAKKNASENKKISTFVSGAKNKVLILGSSWPKDEQVILPIINQGLFDKVIIAPHDIKESHIQAIENQLTVSHTKYTDTDFSQEANVLILNTIGHLSSAFKYGEIAYIGGGFSGKLHNILEPGVYNIPVIIGPKYDRFPEAELFLEKGAAVTISNETEFKNAIQSISENYSNYQNAAHQIIDENKGAATKIINQIEFMTNSKF